jgi:hypothetical protein
MKKVLFLLFVSFLAISACTDTILPDDLGLPSTDDTMLGEGRVVCSEPRPEVCIAQYDPVCGDNGKTYGNSCDACADTAVSYSVLGECSFPIST